MIFRFNHVILTLIVKYTWMIKRRLENEIKESLKEILLLINCMLFQQRFVGVDACRNCMV